MAVTNIKVKQIGEKYFSNKVYTIKVKLYEHEMATVHVDCKKRFRGRNYHGGYIPFDECITESMYDYTETLERMDVDKGARKWLRKVMKHCTQGMVKPNGNIDWQKVNEKENKVYHKSCVELTLNVAQMQIMKRYLPELFVAGNFRFDYQRRPGVKSIHSEEFRYLPVPQKLKSEAARKHYERRIYDVHHHAPVKVLLALIKEISESFYKQIEKERTLDDCCVRMHYTWYQGEKPQLGIDVCDNTYIMYTKH